VTSHQVSEGEAMLEFVAVFVRSELGPVEFQDWRLCFRKEPAGRWIRVGATLLGNS
jgi:hypothetical protein